MLVLVWVALAVGVLAAAGGAALATLRGLRGWRTFRTTSSAATDALDALGAAAATTAERAAAAVEHTAALGEAKARLDRSLAELRVLRHASERPRAGLGLLRGAVPRK